MFPRRGAFPSLQTCSGLGTRDLSAGVCSSSPASARPFLPKFTLKSQQCGVARDFDAWATVNHSARRSTSRTVKHSPNHCRLFENVRNNDLQTYREGFTFRGEKKTSNFLTPAGSSGRRAGRRDGGEGSAGRLSFSSLLKHVRRSGTCLN